MHVYRVTYSPAAGKDQEVTSLLKDRVKERASKGHRIFMMTEALSPQGGHRHQLVSLWDNLNDLGDVASTYVTKGSDPGSTLYRQKIEPLLRAPVQSELWEVLVPIKTAPKVGEFVVRQSIYPDPAHHIDFRSPLVELTKQMQTQGFNVGQYVQFLPHAGSVFQGIFPLSRLGDFEAFIAKRPPEVFTWLRTYSALVRKPFEFELWAMATPPPQM